MASPNEAPSKNAQDQFMDVVDKATTVIPPDKYSKKALLFFDRDQQPRKFCIKLVEHPSFNRVIMVLILLNTVWMTLLTDPILQRKLEDDFLAKRTGGAGGLTSEEAASLANITYDPASTVPEAALGGRKVMYLSHEFAAEAHSWAPIYRPFYDDCVRGTLPPCSADGVVDFIFLLAFTFEMAFKLVASGLLMHSGAYLRSGWNWIDFIVVVTGCLQLSGAGVNLSAIKALRPLRAMQRVRKLRVLVQCIAAALPALGSISVILLFVCTTFGIIGTQLFMGTTRHTCYDCVGEGAYWNGSDCIGGELSNSGEICQPLCKYDANFILLEPADAQECDKPPDQIGIGCGPASLGWCTSLGNATLGQYRHYGANYQFGNMPLLYWTCRPNQQCRCGESDAVDPHCTMLDNPNFGANNFDNVFWAAVTMFQAITLEGWVDAMYTIIDGSGVFAFLYFVTAVLFGACIVLNLFLAVLCDNFALAEDDPNDGPPEEEVDEEEAVEGAAKALNHTSAFRNVCLSITLSKKFMWLITGCIMLNALLMCIQLDPNGRLRAEHNYQPEALFLPVWFLNAILTFVFTFESAVKMIGLGWKVFKMDSFNNFDLVVVVFSLVDVGLDIPAVFYGVEIPLSFPASVLRTFRIIRVLKLARSFENLRIILATLLWWKSTWLNRCISASPSRW
jgi:hypothetical protein